MPGRVLLQDFTGVPAVVDFAAMRDAMDELGGDPALVNPLVPASLVIDHSVQIDRFGSSEAYAFNVAKEYERNGERYQLLRWAQTALRGFRVVPPGTGIVHQVNLEFLSDVVSTRENEEGEVVAFPDSLVGTDSHTTMISGLGILGYGVGGIEAEAVMLGQPLFQPLPKVVGVRLHGALPQGSTATDLVLVISQLLRAHGVVGKFVEYYGDGLASLALADRATLANMAPEYGATTGIFPIDEETLAYLRLTGRDDRVPLVEAYAKEQGLWRLPGATPEFDETLELDLATVVPSVAGPRRPQDRIVLSDLRDSFESDFPPPGENGSGYPDVAVTAGRSRGRHQHRLGGHRGHHQLHQHLQPQRHGRSGTARAQRRASGASRSSPRSRPASRPALARSPSTSRGRACCPLSSSSGSTWWATAAPPASATAARSTRPSTRPSRSTT